MLPIDIGILLPHDHISYSIFSQLYFGLTCLYFATYWILVANSSLEILRSIYATIHASTTILSFMPTFP